MRDRELVELYIHRYISITVIIARPWLCIKLDQKMPLPPSEQAACRRWNRELGVQQQGTVIGERGMEG